jgi:hypothetical protein
VLKLVLCRWGTVSFSRGTSRIEEDINPDALGALYLIILPYKWECLENQWFASKWELGCMFDGFQVGTRCTLLTKIGRGDWDSNA